MERDRRPTHNGWSVMLQERSPSREALDLVAKGKRANKITGELQRMLASSDKVREATVSAHENDITATAYRGQLFADDFFYGIRMMHDQIPRMQTLCEKGALPVEHNPHSKEDDQWTSKFGGLSFSDIEQMELDSQTHRLSQENIERIDKMFRLPGLIGFGRKKNQIHSLENLIYLASQQFGRPRKEVLERFQDNVTAYFDHYADFITDFNRDPKDDMIMLSMLVSGEPYLPIAVGTYVPARLNITPSSAIKLFTQREVHSDPSDKLLWEELGKVFLHSFSQAYRDDVFPADLEQYQHYNADIDSAAALRLAAYIEKTSGAQQQVQHEVRPENLLEQWNKQKKDIAGEAMQHPKKRLEYKLSNDYPAEDVTMVVNKDTFIFIMRFPDDVHLTLELDKAGRLFGVPPSLVKSYPQARDILIDSLLTPLLEKYKVKVAGGNLQNSSSKKATPEKAGITNPPRRKISVRPQTIFESSPLPEVMPTKHNPRRVITSSSDEVIELLGEHGRQKATVNQVLSAIGNFQSGHINGTFLKGTSEPIVHIRAGKYRIFLKRRNGRTYAVKEIKNRGEAY